MRKKIKHHLMPFKSIFILGGTSEIANELCLKFAQMGTKRIHLVSKDQHKQILSIKKLSNYHDLKITYEVVDLLSFNLEKRPKIEFFDLYIICAGYLGDSNIARYDNYEAYKIARINYFALIPWINSITCDKRIAKSGALWIFSSVAMEIGRPSNYHYGAAKAALTIFSEGLFHRCHNKPFKIRILKTGLVDTSMSKNKAPRFLFSKKEDIVNKLVKTPYKEGIEYLPRWWFIVIKIVSILPRCVIAKL